MEIEEIKDKILHDCVRVFSDGEELELYKKFCDNFYCNFRETDIQVFRLDARLKHHAKNIEEVIGQLENTNIKIGKLTNNMDRIGEDNEKIENRNYENANIRCNWEDGKNFYYEFSPFYDYYIALKIMIYNP